jgi:hypothetical protein
MMNREFSISFEEIGQRSYIEGSTYAIADQIKSAGGRWTLIARPGGSIKVTSMPSSSE